MEIPPLIKVLRASQNMEKTFTLSKKELKYILNTLEHTFNEDKFFMIHKELIEKFKNTNN